MYDLEQEWDAMTPEEQEEQWESFHEENAAGTADNLYFYEVMMARHLVGYVGH